MDIWWEAIDKLNATNPIRIQKDSLAKTVKNQNDSETDTYSMHSTSEHFHLPAGSIGL